ncbi:MAG: hypothetical protein ACJAQ2_002546 [Vicingaceae bacterium]
MVLPKPSSIIIAKAVFDEIFSINGIPDFNKIGIVKTTAFDQTLPVSLHFLQRNEIPIAGEDLAPPIAVKIKNVLEKLTDILDFIDGLPLPKFLKPPRPPVTSTLTIESRRYNEEDPSSHNYLQFITTNLGGEVAFDIDRAKFFPKPIVHPSFPVAGFNIIYSVNVGANVNIDYKVKKAYNIDPTGSFQDMDYETAGLGIKPVLDGTFAAVAEDPLPGSFVEYEAGFSAKLDVEFNNLEFRTNNTTGKFEALFTGIANPVVGSAYANFSIDLGVWSANPINPDNSSLPLFKIPKNPIDIYIPISL